MADRLCCSPFIPSLFVITISERIKLIVWAYLFAHTVSNFAAWVHGHLLKRGGRL